MCWSFLCFYWNTHCSPGNDLGNSASSTSADGPPTYALTIGNLAGSFAAYARNDARTTAYGNDSGTTSIDVGSTDASMAAYYVFYATYSAIVTFLGASSLARMLHLDL